MHRRSFLAGLAAVSALAAPALGGTPRIYAPGGLALRGTDPVAYVSAGQAVAGHPDHAVMWRGAIWLFAEDRHRAAFEADPFRFAPEFGGYCAFAVSRGYTAATDPEAFTIHAGRLYLNYSLAVRDVWRSDPAGHIAKAMAHWPALLG